MRTRRLALTEGVSAGVLFGTAAIFIRFLPDLDAYYIAFWRLVISVLALGTVFLVTRRSLDLGKMRENLKDLVVLGLLLGLHFVLFASAVKDTTILNATVLVNTTPIYSMLISSLAFSVKPSRIAMVGLLISFAGVIVIVLGKTVSQPSSPQAIASLKGDSEAILAAIVEAFYLNYGRRTRRSMNLLSSMLPIYLLTACTVAVLSLPAKSNILRLPSGLEHSLPLLGLGVLPTATAHTLYFSSLSNLKSFETAAMALIEPVIATLLGVGLFGETPMAVFVAGAALVLVGIYFVAKE